ncbi:MAG TPA: T9SS type A sorting domain-containing protein [Chryseosolibacter sp.]|nr:T9SS type A sorting domain-containing protein [Chryseosolibacter sp.]
MVRFLVLICFLIAAGGVNAQSFELLGLQDTYRGNIGETIKVPLRLKNLSDKPITLTVRKVSAELGSTQKNFFCVDDNCSDTEDFTVRLDPGQTLTPVQVGLEAGLAQGVSSMKYLAYNKANPAESFEFELNFIVEEASKKQDIYMSTRIMLHDVYPNPVTEYAFVSYHVVNQQVKAKIVIHNILGNAMEDYPLPASENVVKISVAALNSGIYFYTLYVDNEGVITRKLIVKK